MVTVPRPGSQRFRDKIERYRSFINADRPVQRYAASAIRILTVTLTRARSQNLCADTDAFLKQPNSPRLRKSFLCGSLKDISIAEPQSIIARRLQKRASVVKWFTEEPRLSVSLLPTRTTGASLGIFSPPEAWTPEEDDDHHGVRIAVWPD